MKQPLKDPGRYGGDLYKPGLEVVVDDDVIAVALVAMPVRHHHRGHSLYSYIDPSLLTLVFKFPASSRLSYPIHSNLYLYSSAFF